MPTSPKPTRKIRYTLYRTQKNQETYMRQEMFNPVIPVLIDAINNGKPEGFPFMKVNRIHKYLAPSLATAKGIIKCPCVGIRSTRT